MTKIPLKLTGLLLLAVALAACQRAEDAGISVSNAWARATPPDSSVAAVYLEITAGSDDTLLGATTSAATSAQVHVTQEDAGMSSMHHVEGFAVPKGSTQRFTPGGTHLMLMGLQQPLRAGEQFAVMLHFEHAGDVPVEVEVVEPNAAR